METDAMAQLAQAVMNAQALVAADSRSVTAFAALDEALNARGEFHWSRGDPEAADDFQACIAANDSRIAIAPEDPGGHVGLVRSHATIAEWNTQQGDAAWALHHLELAVAASKRVRELRAAGHPLPEGAAASLKALQRSLEAFAGFAETGPLHPDTAAKVASFFERLSRR
ncbi:MAG: hypothetical protein QM817_21025 [Archangium sp.]